MSESNYDKINKGVCPDCGEKLIYLDDGDRKGCETCGIIFKFIDDMGPGSYRRSEWRTQGAEMMQRAMESKPKLNVSDLPTPLLNIFKGRPYRYKGNDYTFVDFTRIKFGGVWLGGVVYSDKDGYLYTREQLDFMEKFKPV